MDFVYFIVFLAIRQNCAYDVYDFQTPQIRPAGSNFSFKNCERPDSFLHITELNIHPHPITLGDILLLKLAFNLTKDIGIGPGGVEVDMTLGLKTPTDYVSLCEILGKRFCHWNLCGQLKKLKEHCTPELRNMTDSCNCPMKAGYLKPVLVPFKTSTLPFYLRATFDITIEFKDEGKHIGCVDIHLCVNECMFL